MSLKPYGVQYKPGNSTGPKISVKDLEKLGIRYVRITWVDLINNIRYKVLSLSYFRRLLESGRPGVAVPTAAFGLVNLQLAEGFAPIGEYLYVPDLTTMRICPYAEGHASVFGWFQVKVPPLNGSLEVELCPRTLLKKVLQYVQFNAIPMVLHIRAVVTDTKLR
jgi:glutamine synthetase